MKREPLFVGWTLTIPQLPLGGFANAALLRLFLKDHQRRERGSFNPQSRQRRLNGVAIKPQPSTPNIQPSLPRLESTVVPSPALKRRARLKSRSAAADSGDCHGLRG